MAVFVENLSGSGWSCGSDELKEKYVTRENFQSSNFPFLRGWSLSGYTTSENAVCINKNNIQRFQSRDFLPVSRIKNGERVGGALASDSPRALRAHVLRFTEHSRLCIFLSLNLNILYDQINLKAGYTFYLSFFGLRKPICIFKQCSITLKK